MSTYGCTLSRMRRGGVWLAAVSAVAVAIAAWVSTAPFVPVLRGAVERPPTAQRVEPPRLDNGAGGRREDLQQATGLGTAATTFIYVVLTLFALALLAIIWRSAQQRRRLRDAVPVATEPAAAETFDDIDADVARDLSRTAQSGLSILEQGMPRDAIVRCWMMLEEAVAMTGFERNPALTSEEFTAAVLTRYAVRSAAIAELAGLYREARFSSHALGEPHRRRAVQALNAVRDDLDRERSTPQPTAPVASTPPGSR